MERSAVTVRVPAKVNLHLGVGARRADGYHDVVTVLHAVSLYDEVTVGVAAADVDCRVIGDGADDVPAGNTNLAVRAVRELAAVVDRRPAVAIEIRKGIPIAGGMAGGSADAAAALVACHALWGLSLDRSRLADIAARVGSDVPFLLNGGTALGTGRGERITTVLGRGECHWVLALADRGLATTTVYDEYDAAPPVTSPPPDGVLAALRSGDVVALGRALHNDLQQAALRLRPSLRRTLDAGTERGAIGAVISGSGPTCAFLTRSRAEAVAIAAGLSGAGVCRSVRIAHGPVPGAGVVDPT